MENFAIREISSSSAFLSSKWSEESNIVLHFDFP